MGASNSTINPDIPLFAEQFPNITIRPLHLQTSTVPTDRESSQTAAISSSRSQNGMTSFSPGDISSKASIPPKRLPPVESRETVRSQAFQITNWRAVDNSDEIYESVEIENSGCPPSPPSDTCTNISFSDLDIKPSLAEINEALAIYEAAAPSHHEKAGSFLSPIDLDPPRANLKKSLNKRSLSSSPEPRKKRRLVPTKRAIEIANQKFEKFGGMSDYLQSQPMAPRPYTETYNQEKFGFVNPFPHGFPLSDDEGWLRPDPHPGSCLYQDSDHEDEGYWSNVVSPANSGDGESPEEQQERLSNLLSRFHGHKPITSKSSATTSKAELDEEEQLMQLAREYMHIYQEAGVERSRQLRENALRRRGLLPTIESGSMSEQSKTVSDTEGDNSSRNDLFSDDDGQSQCMEDLLDIAQEHVTKNSNPTQTEVRDKAKIDRHVKRPTAQNPASRAAAEQFRTQSRHLGGDRNPQIEDIGSQTSQSRESHDLGSISEELSLQEKEERLREAQKAVLTGHAARGRVSNPPQDNKFPRDDEINPRARRNHLREESNDRASYLGSAMEQPKAQVSASAENEANNSPSTRPLSGLEMLAAKREAAIKQNDGSNSLDRPLSGLEMLAAKREVARGQMSESNHLDRPLFGLETLAAKRGASHTESRDTESQPSQERFARLSSSIVPGSNRGLTLPKNFDQFSEEQKEVVVQHEIAKERKRDLDALGSVFWTFAQLRCFADREITERTMQIETNELYDIGKFIALVIEQGKPGKMRRTRVQDIRDNIRRRVQKAAENEKEPSDVAIMTEMRRTFSRKHIDFINDETPKVQEEIDRWGVLRSERKSKRHVARPKETTRNEWPKERTEEKGRNKQVRFAEHETKVAQKKRPKSKAKTIENRQSQSELQEKLIEKLRAQLKLFETAEQEEVADLQSRVAEIEAELERATQHDDDDESEEDDGAEFVFGAGQNATSMPRTSRVADSQTFQGSNMWNEQDIEDGCQRDTGMHIPATSQPKVDPELLKQMRLKKSQPTQSQGFDPELLRQMQLRKQQQLEAATDSTVIDRATAGESDSESETMHENNSDEDEEDDDEEEEDEDRQVFRYTVWGVFVGVEIYKDADHYYFMKTYNAKQAQKKVLEIIEGINGYARSEKDIEPSQVNVNTKLHYELIEQHLVVGEDATIEARVWIERDLVDLKKKVFRAAKRQRAVKQAATFAVRWEKTTTPIMDSAVEEIKTATATATAESDGLDDLFEESAEDIAKAAAAAAAAAAPVTTSIPHDDVELFTTPILANRHAKDVYLAWHNTFLPGWRNEGYRRLEDESMEEYLETLGSWGLFAREESFERVEADKSNGNGAAQRRVEETFKVWVKKIPVKGPGN
ncbi:hypothetical protein CLAIMM_05811 [Cladophialophora immunda]|nr:hypothetical protein CLAIMM_05811 [Cladophialophora immunda]